MQLDDPDFDPTTSKSATLAVVLHGFSWPQTVKEAFAFVLKGFSWPSRVKIDRVVQAVRDEYSEGGVDVYAPAMPYSNILDSTGANDIVVAVKTKLDDIWSKKPGGYEKVVLVGHSMGGVLLRRVFLCGSPRAPDYSGALESRDDLAKVAPGDPDGGGWAGHVERLVLIATWDKGWSISQRDSWFYSLALNILGFLGHVTPEKGRFALASTAFDMRRGAAFIVQTRMLWLAYRRWHNLAHGAVPLDLHKDVAPRGADPLVVQIIGTDDDFISPQDQVDNDVNGALPSDPAPRYFLLEIKNTDHAGAIDFSGPHGEERERVVRAALREKSFEIGPASGPAEALRASDPLLYDDERSQPDPSVKHVCFVIHGIRDDGFWTHRIAKTIREHAAKSGDAAVASIRCIATSYGYFAMLPFILPWVRRQKVEWFMDRYVKAKAQYPNARFHYVGHSNGTYLAARALRDYSAARFGNIYFAGSVVRPDYPWRKAAEAGRIERFHNVRGATDWVVAIAPKGVDYASEDLGAGGFDGFLDARSDGADAVTQSKRCAWGGHGGAITEGHWPGIARFIVSGETPPEPEGLFAPGPHKLLDYFTRPRFFSVPLAAIAVSSFVVWLIESFFACDEGGSYAIPYYCLIALAIVSVGLFAVFPNKPPSPQVTRILKLVTLGAGLLLFGWFAAMLLALVFAQCGYALWAFVLVAVLAAIRFVSTRF